MGFNVIDQIIVGLLGADAVAAVGLSNSVASIALLLYASADVGAGVMVARAFGRKDLGEVSRITAAGEALAGGLGLLTALLLVAFGYTTLFNVIERSDGVKIGAFFIAAIIASSFVSRV